MATVLNQSESLRTRYFNVTHYISAYFGCSIYDAVWRIDKNNKKKIKQFYGNLPACKKDCEDMKYALKRFQFTDPDHTYDLINPKAMECARAISKIKKHLQNTPEVNSFIFYCVAGHGMVAAGEQQLLINEFKEKTTFYKMIGIEADIRDIAKTFANSY